MIFSPWLRHLHNWEVSMNRNRLIGLIAGVALVAFVAGCHTSGSTNNDANRGQNAKANVNVKNTHSISREEYERNKERHRQEAKENGSRIGKDAEDFLLWTKTRAALADTSGLTSTGIKVDVENGMITLRGTVPHASELTRAEHVARAVEGNKGIHNQLAISTRADDSTTGQVANRKGK
jgi:osmotically-inducible protein OsmY